MKGAPWRRAGALAAATLPVLLAAPAVATPAADFWTTLRVTLDLVLADTDALAVDVDTCDGVVTLHGFASNDTERAKAESIARGAGATRPVRNLIQVVPEASRRDDEIARRAAPAEPLRDAWLEAAARLRLLSAGAGSGEADRSIAVRARGGVVTLGGRVRSAEEGRRVAEMVERIALVRGVENELAVASPRRRAGAAAGSRAERDAAARTGPE